MGQVLSVDRLFSECKGRKLPDDRTGFRPRNVDVGYLAQRSVKLPAKTHEKASKDEPKDIANDTHFNPGRLIGGEGVSPNKTLTTLKNRVNPYILLVKIQKDLHDTPDKYLYSAGN
jgi:hypothetical protein